MAWFKDWFNSPYYHILYGKRNDTEANLFIKNIDGLLHFKKGEKALDLACGKGRHARELASYHLNVEGVDLSAESIKEAMQFESPQLHFNVHDMRKTYRKTYFDYVFNIFTSFGYFSNVGDNIATLHAVRENLKPGGIFIQDYFNAKNVEDNLIPEEHKELEGIRFSITKAIKDCKIIKTIQFTDNEAAYRFSEEVNLFCLEDFEKMYEAAGLKITAIYGDYNLSAYDPEHSSRIILISSPA